eukprot:scaffold12455_cov88-Skeletonema_marinoi.AAC.1
MERHCREHCCSTQCQAVDRNAEVVLQIEIEFRIGKRTANQSKHSIANFYAANGLYPRQN